MTSRKSEGFLHSRVRASYTLRSIWARILYHSKIFPENRLNRAGSEAPTLSE